MSVNLNIVGFSIQRWLTRLFRSGFTKGSCLLLFVLANILMINNAQADSSIQTQAESLKQDVIQLNTELSSLEESLLYPVNSRIGIYLSVDNGKHFELDSISLKIDGRNATTYIYTDKEVKALEEGGTQRLYIGNLASGTHQLTVSFNGQGADNHYFRREKKFKFKKEDQIKNMELKLMNSTYNNEPTLKLQTWN